MTVKKVASNPAADSAETSGTQGVQSTTPVVLADAVQGPVYRDKEYTSRTLILPDDSAVLVAKGRITASTAQLVAFLDGRPDFERLAG